MNRIQCIHLALRTHADILVLKYKVQPSKIQQFYVDLHSNKDEEFMILLAKVNKDEE